MHVWIAGNDSPTYVFKSINLDTSTTNRNMHKFVNSAVKKHWNSHCRNSNGNTNMPSILNFAAYCEQKNRIKNKTQNKT